MGFAHLCSEVNILLKCNENPPMGSGDIGHSITFNCDLDPESAFVEL